MFSATRILSEPVSLMSPVVSRLGSDSNSNLFNAPAILSMQLQSWAYAQNLEETALAKRVVWLP